MNFKYKTLYVLCFIALFCYTILGIGQLGRAGGPCNGGLALIILGPAIIVCTILVLFSFSFFVNSVKNAPAIMMASLSLAIWTYCLVSFAGDDIGESFLFLGPFELFIIATLVIEIKTKKLTNPDNKQR